MIRSRMKSPLCSTGGKMGKDSFLANADGHQRKAVLSVSFSFYPAFEAYAITFFIGVLRFTAALWPWTPFSVIWNHAHRLRAALEG
jgi:hypothetical protein